VIRIKIYLNSYYYDIKESVDENYYENKNAILHKEKKNPSR
jgi:hypothetical protein